MFNSSAQELLCLFVALCVFYGLVWILCSVLDFFDARRHARWRLRVNASLENTKQRRDHAA